MNEGAHLTIDGLQKIVNVKASIILSTSDLVNLEFNNVNPVERSLIQITNISDPNWISGYVSGEVNFYAGIRNKTIKLVI